MPRGGVKPCTGCDRLFEPRHYNQRYCAPECGIPAKNCSRCGSEFVPDRYYQARKTCSADCKNAEMAHRNRTTQRVNKPGGLTKAERAKIGEAQASQREGTGYVKVAGRHEHRVVAERVLGRELGPGEVVHHEDQDKMNNNPDNLIVFPSQAVHARHHKLDHLGAPCDCPGTRLQGVI